MEVFKTRFSNFVSWVFFGLFLVITFCVVFLDGGEFSLNQNYPIVSIILGLALAGAITFLYFKLFRKKTKHKLAIWKEVLIVSIAIILLFLVGLYIINKLEVRPDWDYGALYEAATTKLRQGNFGEWTNYISNFPFQIFLAYLYVFYLKIVGGIFEPHYALMLLNLLFIIGTIIIFYFSIRKLLGARKAIFSLVFFVLFSPILLYSPIFYSDTISMFFVAVCFFLSLFICDSELKISKRIILSLLFGLALFCGFQIKATSAIVAIAVIIFIALIQKKFIGRKAALISAASVVAVMAPLMLVVSHVRSSIVDPELEIPKTHWLMMGLKDYGGWNGEDYELITMPGLSTRDELVNRQVTEIKSRFGNYGPIGYIGFLLKKLSFTWGDGTYYVSEKLSRGPSHPDSTIYQIVAKNGQHNQAYRVIMNAMQFMLLALVCIGAYLTRHDRSAISIIKLSIIGLTLFLLAWETRSRYLINYLPLLLIFAAYTLDQMPQQIPKLIKAKQKKIKKHAK